MLVSQKSVLEIQLLQLFLLLQNLPHLVKTLLSKTLHIKKNHTQNSLKILLYISKNVIEIVPTLKSVIYQNHLPRLHVKFQKTVRIQSVQNYLLLLHVSLVHQNLQPLFLIFLRVLFQKQLLLIKTLLLLQNLLLLFIIFR